MKPVSHIASSSSRPPMLSRLSMESENRVLLVVRQVPQRQSIIPRGSESGLQFGYLNCTRSRCFDNYFNSRLYVRSGFNNDCGSDRYTARIVMENAPFSSVILSTHFSIIRVKKKYVSKETWHFWLDCYARGSLNRLSKNTFKKKYVKIW